MCNLSLLEGMSEVIEFSRLKLCQEVEPCRSVKLHPPRSFQGERIEESRENYIDKDKERADCILFKLELANLSDVPAFSCFTYSDDQKCMGIKCIEYVLNDQTAEVGYEPIFRKISSKITLVEDFRISNNLKQTF